MNEVTEFLENLKDRVGSELGATPWFTINQTMADVFGHLTGNPDPMHNDPEWGRNGPWGGTIAHGFNLLERDFLDRLGEELADKTDRREGQRENAGQRAEAYVLRAEEQLVYTFTVPERSAPIEISATLDFQPGRMLGKTLDSKDGPMPGARLALMSTDRNKRRLGSYWNSPYWKETTSDRDGSFRFPDVIPGDYLLIVWPQTASWEDLSGLDPDAFAILEQHATSVHVDRAQAVEKNVQLTEEVRNLLERLLR